MDGIYFDEDHWPREGCWCPSTAAGFKLHTGLELPASKDPEDPRYQRLLAYGAVAMERAFRRLRHRIKGVAPDVALLIGSNRAPDALESFGSDRLWRLADGVKTEYGKGHGLQLREFLRQQPADEEPARDVWLALGWLFSRDAAQGRPPHVWCNAITDPRAARAAAAAVIAYGGVANLDCKEAGIPDHETFGSAFQLGNRLSEHLGGARPERWAAIHWPGALREQVWRPEQVYERIAGPLGEACELLMRSRRPVSVITDSLLTDGDFAGLRVLLLPAPSSLDRAQRIAVESFKSAGGLVLSYEGEWKAKGLSELPYEHGRVAGGPARLHVIPHRGPKGERFLALLNDPGWVFTEPRFNKAGRPNALPKGTDIQPEPCEDISVVLPEGVSAVFECVRGEELEIQAGSVSVPPFQEIALLRLE